MLHHGSDSHLEPVGRRKFSLIKEPKEPLTQIKQYRKYMKPNHTELIHHERIGDRKGSIYHALHRSVSLKHYIIGHSRFHQEPVHTQQSKCLIFKNVCPPICWGIHCQCSFSEKKRYCSDAVEMAMTAWRTKRSIPQRGSYIYILPLPKRL